MARPILLIAFISIAFLSCNSKKDTEHSSIDSTYYQEKYRPAYHFTPEKNWMNDPNGLVFYEGEYHLFYQHNPYGNVWGHMSWGHAVSPDLLHWKKLPLALEEYIDKATGDSTMIFSGTVVVDKNNSSGFCTNGACMIAIYTSHVHKNNEAVVQHQSLAYSNDKGRTWNRYDKNPILNIQRKDFRDPKVFWYEPEQKWVMVLVVPDLFTVQFYESKNLTEWKMTGSFNKIGDTTRIWECPDLYELPIENLNEKRWVLSLSGGHPQGPAFVGMQYFVGTFDGKTFKADDAHQKPLYVNYGKDFYAGIVFNNLPKEDNRTIMIGWINNWTYANTLPTHPWRSAMSIPHELSLQKTSDGLRLAQKPAKEMAALRDSALTNLADIKESSLEIELAMILNDAKEVGIKISQGTTEETILSYNRESGLLFLDRTHSGLVDFHKEFASVEIVTINKGLDKIKLHIFIDNGIIEVFANNGQQTLSENTFPTSEKYSISTFSKDGKADMNLKAWKLKSVW
jgi:fructan beta-fructosidase